MAKEEKRVITEEEGIEMTLDSGVKDPDTEGESPDTETKNPVSDPEAPAIDSEISATEAETPVMDEEIPAVEAETPVMDDEIPDAEIEMTEEERRLQFEIQEFERQRMQMIAGKEYAVGYRNEMGEFIIYQIDYRQRAIKMNLGSGELADGIEESDQIAGRAVDNERRLKSLKYELWKKQHQNGTEDGSLEDPISHLPDPHGDAYDQLYETGETRWARTYNEILEKVRELFQRLTVSQRELIDYCYVKKMPFSKFAAMKGISRAAVTQRHQRIEATLKKLLAEQGFDEAYIDGLFASLFTED